MDWEQQHRRRAREIQVSSENKKKGVEIERRERARVWNGENTINPWKNYEGINIMDAKSRSGDTK